MQCRSNLKQEIASRARGLGFDVVGVAGAESLEAWRREVDRRVASGLIPTGYWRQRDLRANPRDAMPNASCVIVLARPYAPHDAPFPSGVAGYSAHYREYPKGFAAARELAEWLARETGADAAAESRLPAKALAVMAGVGSHGKNSLIMCREFGSFVTIHTVLTCIPLEPDAAGPIDSGCCGGCDACVRACPTAAIRPGGAVELARCVRTFMGSAEIVPRELRAAFGTSIVGCDECQRCCPRNAGPLKRAALPPADELEAFSLAGLLGERGAALKARLARMAAVIGPNYARRNHILTDAAIAAGNSADPSLAQPLSEMLRHAHVPVRAHSAWAIGRLRTEHGRKALANALSDEPDPFVSAEIKAALEET